MAFTLAEYKKQTQDEFRAAVIQTYIDNSPFLDRLTFQNIIGGSVTFNREQTLPTGTGFRDVNNEYTPSNGVVEQVTESLKIAGGRTNVDRALEKMYGPERMATDVQMQVKALARTLNEALFKGDGTGGSFTGLETRIQASEQVDNGTAALSLAAVRDAILELEGENAAMFMSKKMYSYFWKAYNDGNIQSEIQFQPNQFGLPVATFGGVPLIQAGKDTTGSEILPFEEGVGTNETSIYAVSFDSADGVVGIQNSPLETIPLSEISVLQAVDIEWLMNFMIQAPKSAIRIKGITDGAITA